MSTPVPSKRKPRPFRFGPNQGLILKVLFDGKKSMTIKEIEQMIGLSYWQITGALRELRLKDLVEYGKKSGNSETYRLTDKVAQSQSQAFQALFDQELDALLRKSIKTISVGPVGQDAPPHIWLQAYAKNADATENLKRQADIIPQLFAEFYAIALNDAMTPVRKDMELKMWRKKLEAAMQAFQKFLDIAIQLNANPWFWRADFIKQKLVIAEQLNVEDLQVWIDAVRINYSEYTVRDLGEVD